MSKQSRRLRLSSLILTILPAVLVTAILAPTPTATAGSRVGFSLHVSIPARIHVYDAHLYEPYYVGRVFYPPANHWQRIYSFPVQTQFGIVYQPHVYDGGRLICQGYIPGRDFGYGAVVIDGRGHYNPHWARGNHAGWAHGRRVAYPDTGRHGRNDDRRPRDRSDRSDSGSHAGHERRQR